MEQRGDSASDGEVVVPGTAFTKGTGVCRAIYVGTGGDVEVRFVNGNEVVFPDVPSGFELRVHATMVVAAGTAASGLVAMF